MARLSSRVARLELLVAEDTVTTAAARPLLDRVEETVRRIAADRGDHKDARS